MTLKQLAQQLAGTICGVTFVKGGESERVLASTIEKFFTVIEVKTIENCANELDKMSSQIDFDSNLREGIIFSASMLRGSVTKRNKK